MEKEDRGTSFTFLGKEIETLVKNGELFVCITSSLEALNNARNLNGYSKVRIDDRLSSDVTKRIIDKLIIKPKENNPIDTITDLKKIGLAYRRGKGNGQKWFVHYKIFIAIFSKIDDFVEVEMMSIFINAMNPLSILNNMSKIKDEKRANLNIKTYIAIDRLRNICKIGKTVDLKKRYSSLRTSNKHIEYIYIIDKDIEDDMHKILNGFRIEGEWFDMDKDMISGIAKRYGFMEFNGF